MGKSLSEKYEGIIPKTIFHYTSFEKFKCILRYGTWSANVNQKVDHCAN